MTTEATTNPVADDTSRVATAGVDAPGNDAQTNDDFDTEQFDRAPATDEGTDAAEADPDAPQPVTAAAADDETVELEDDAGQKVRVPKALQGAFLRQQDYTRKTQEVAEQRRTLDTERTTWESQREESRAALPEEHAKVAVLSHSIASAEANLKQFDQIDWATFRTQALAEPEGEQARLYKQYRAAFDAAGDTLADLKRDLQSASGDLSAKETERLAKQTQERETALASAREQTGKVLAQEIPGWSPQVAQDIATFAIKEVGVKPDEIPEMLDPRIWKVLHRAMKAEERATKAETAVKQNTTANTHKKAAETTPAASTAGGGAASTRVRDDIGTSEWMRRRNAQRAKA